MLLNHIGTQRYEECQEDILAMSGMAEDIRDALLDYHVGDNKISVAIMPLTLGYLDRQPSNLRCMSRIAG